MAELDALAWVLLGCGALVVGFSKTALPAGVTLSVALFAMVLPARESTAALLVLLLAGDLFACWFYRRDVDWGTLRRLIWPVIIGLIAGTVLLGLASDDVVRRVIGVVLLVLLVYTLWRRYRSAKHRRDGGSEPGSGTPSSAAGYAYGSLGGFTTMVANAGGPVMSMYLLAMRLPIRTFLGTTAFFFFTVNLSKLPFQIGLGLLNWETLRIAAVLTPLVVVAALFGRWTASRISQKLFDRAILVLTAVAAVNLLL